MPAAIEVAPGIAIPAAAIRMSVSRASGPGGQNVNKVSSKVELRADPRQITGLTSGARQRLMESVAARLDQDGWIVIKSQRTRDQHRNLEDARMKLREIVRRALPEPRRRRPTKPSKGSREARLVAKKQTKARKAGRRRMSADD